MKKFLTIVLLLALILSCGGCGAKDSVSSWQKQYDLGVRYLSEGNYEKAVIAFTAAIEIDPKQAPAYVGRGDARIGLGAAEENLMAAIADYKAALELDNTNADIYLKLADMYIGRGDYDSAKGILELGMQKCPSDEIEEMLAALAAYTSTIVLDKTYFNREILRNARATIGGRDFINMSYDEMVAYYGAQKDEYADGTQYADTEQSTYDPNPHIHIQQHADSQVFQVSISYSSRHGNGIEIEKNQPEFLGIKIGDALDDVVQKIGIAEELFDLLDERNADYFYVQLLPDYDQDLVFELTDLAQTSIDIHWDVSDEIHEWMKLIFDENDILVDFMLTRQMVTD